MGERSLAIPPATTFDSQTGFHLLKNIYVGNIPFSANEEELKALIQSLIEVGKAAQGVVAAAGDKS